MLKFDFEKFQLNCPEWNFFVHWDAKNLMELLHSPKKRYLLNFVKSFIDETGFTLEDIISHLTKNKEIEIDINKIQENIKLCKGFNCQNCVNEEECIYKDKGINPFKLGYKETASSINAVEYPVDSFPPTLRDYIKQMSEAIVAPPQYIGTALLALLSTLCCRFSYIQATPTWKIPLTSYYLIIGDVSTKKTPSINMVLQLLDSQISKEDRILANDSTIEALEQLLLRHRSILLHADESGIMDTLGGYTRTNSASSSKILSLYTCKPYRVDRKGQEPIFIQEPKLSILAGVQPSVLMHSQNLMRTGMLQRFIIAYAERSRKYFGFSVSNINEKTKKDTLNFITNLYKCGQDEEIIELTISKGALYSLKLIQEELFKDINEAENDALRDYYGKYIEHLLKIAGLFQLVINSTGNKESREITLDTFNMAFNVADYYSCVSKNLFEGLNTSKAIDTDNAYKELLKKCKDRIFNPTFLHATGIGGCDARKKEYTESFIERLIQQNRCVEWFGHGSKGRKFVIIKE